MQAISTQSLSKQYEGGTVALSDLDLSVDEGQVFGFLGPNGAGKSTTVRILNGTLGASGGSFTIFGDEPSGEKIRSISGTLSESARMYEQMSAMENLRFFGGLYGMEEQEIRNRGMDLIERLGLRGREDDKLGTFSTGMKKRLQLARTLLHRPRLLFLDEPTSGLDPEAAAEVTDLIRDLSRQEKTTLFLCTHNLTIAERVCDTVAFLDRGRLVAQGSAAELAAKLGRKPRLVLELLDPETGSRSREEYPVDSPEEINPHLLRCIREGKLVLSSSLPEPTLEELYFAYIGGKQS